MNSFIKKALCMLLVLYAGSYLKAQNNSTKIIGVLIEDATSLAIPYATVVLHDKTSKKIIVGTTSNDKGAFSITTTHNNFYLEISFMGFKTKTITTFNFINKKADLGNIILTTDKQALDEVVVTGEVSKTVFKLDKRVFNVGADISSTGASALEVLNNVPSVNVNIEGEISLRGSTGVQILINGKPSVLADESSNALGTITADMIESIEVITNPSAKYEASGTAGILNIILKKEEKKGWNGAVSLNTGTPDNHSIGLSLNRRTESFNLFAQLGAGYRSIPKKSEAINTDLVNNEVIFSNGTESRDETFYNLTLGTDYYINDLNVITLSGNFAYEVEEQPSETNFSYFDATNSLISSWVRNEITDATNPKYTYELNYKKEFKNNEEHTLLFSALGRFFGKDQSSEFTNTTISGTDSNSEQETETNFKQANYTFKIDYTNPISNIYTLETGAQYVINDVGNDYEVRDVSNGVFVVDEDLTNDFEYNQKVLGVYVTGAYEKEKWGIKAGLRVEHTNLTTLLTNTNEANEQNFTNIFPTLHSSYKVAEDFSLQAGYSKRIYRPGLRDLNPFFNIRNNFNIRVGNPNLQPEFTDSYELTSIYKIGKASLSSSFYHQYTTDMVQQVSTYVDNVTISTPENIGTDSAFGFETNGKYRPNNWLTITGNVNFNYFDRKGSYETQIFDFSGSQWSSKLGSKIGLPADIDLELTGNYQSGYKTVQGSITGFVFLDVGVRKKIFKGKAIVNLGVRDLFESRNFEQFVSQTTFETYSFTQRGRFVTLGISYGFGKGEAMTYSGGRRR
ncbi:Outer membrane receptor proteins, mostly Fe transport [Polaribacter sp. KT25b]|uniref:outer membrane beta-barrel family protein n=1 Tax=Polaribacter sp. KT25b TaxID=1855336 RepID=UPI00087AAD6F|nr:outer membrane beta-barrel family protein [Polaribacter sp. KT25b]SDR95956.1 Outer membrane receptor proteins, mostly Fe transport [Polaribacter sp. KT25b]